MISSDKVIMIVRLATVAASVILIYCTICDDNDVMDETGSNYLFFSDKASSSRRMG